MRLEVELNLNYPKLLALYTASERCFRKKEMLLFRIIFLLLGVLNVYRSWISIQGSGLGFKNSGNFMLGVIFLIAAVIPNIISAGCAKLRAVHKGTVQFDNNCYYEVIGERKIRHNYDKVFALVKFRGYDFIFLNKLSSLILELDNVPGHTAAEIRGFLEHKCDKKYRYL